MRSSILDTPLTNDEVAHLRATAWQIPVVPCADDCVFRQLARKALLAYTDAGWRLTVQGWLAYYEARRGRG